MKDLACPLIKIMFVYTVWCNKREPPEAWMEFRTSWPTTVPQLLHKVSKYPDAAPQVPKREGPFLAQTVVVPDTHLFHPSSSTPHNTARLVFRREFLSLSILNEVVVSWTLFGQHSVVDLARWILVVCVFVWSSKTLLCLLTTNLGKLSTSQHREPRNWCFHYGIISNTKESIDT